MAKTINVDKKISIAKSLEVYYEKLAVLSLTQKIQEKLYKIADDLASEIMDQYDVKTVFLKKPYVASLKKDKIILTVILEPKEKET